MFVNANNTEIDQRFLDLSSSTKNFRERWSIPNYELLPWITRPCTVRILLYADYNVTLTNPLPDPFDPGSTNGFDLGKVNQVLTSDPWFWVKFDVTFKRRNQPNSNLDQLDIEKNYDQIWFFGFGSNPTLTPNEITVLDSFMRKKQGGIFMTGDHANLGAGIGQQIPRAGKMRKWPAPNAQPPEWNSTLCSGADGLFQFNDQSDDVPQQLRLKTYPVGFPWSPLYWRRAPHPLFCSQWGPIDVFPDHQHEGECSIPNNFPQSEWPVSSGGYQPKPEIIAWGKVIDPSANPVREVANTAVYDGHRAGVGRIVTDSTWHHWFNINLWGFPQSKAGLNALRKIEAHFLNVAVWLASPQLQKCMFAAMCWGLRWHWSLREVLGAKPIVLGTTARDVFGRYASQCILQDFIWGRFKLLPQLKFQESVEELEFLPQAGPVEDLFLGEYLFEIGSQFQKDLTQDPQPPELNDLVEFIAPALKRSTSKLFETQIKGAELFQELIQLEDEL
ncbi:hypothetical protein [Dapis sp. BLCC M229]|uniref:hypothetical protein n=1 Tax=Dapis sp. BLCC M229 TaxID=3400188 RepID=UPI003CF8870D